MNQARPYSQQCAAGRRMAAKAMAALAATGNVPAFAREAESILALAPGVRAGWFAAVAEQLRD